MISFSSATFHWCEREVGWFGSKKLVRKEPRLTPLGAVMSIALVLLTPAMIDGADRRPQLGNPSGACAALPLSFSNRAEVGGFERERASKVRSGMGKPNSA